MGRSAAKQEISPALDPVSSKKFDKDYPADARPGVDVLHFKHPYPVVQDSGDFDKDYVKDENSDNGHWKAQQEYDRLRHKLAMEKKEAAAALAKKKAEEKDLKAATEKYESEQDKKNAAEAKKRKAEEDKRKAAEAEKQKPAEAQSGQGWTWSWPSWWPFSWPKWGESEAAPAPAPVKKEGTGVKGAAKDTEKAIDNLKDCQDELAKAKDELKKVMEELDNAKAKQSNADAAFDSAKKTQLETKTLAEKLHDKSSKEQAEHDTAEAAYLKQKEVVAKMKAELDAAAAKVKAHRDAADADGGVYNTPEEKSMTISLSSPRVLVLVLATVASYLSA